MGICFAAEAVSNKIQEIPFKVFQKFNSNKLLSGFTVLVVVSYAGFMMTDPMGRKVTSNLIPGHLIHSASY